MALTDVIRVGSTIAQVTVLPPTCAPGDPLVFLLTGPNPGLYFCSATNVWSIYDNVIVAPLAAVPVVTSVRTICAVTSFIDITEAAIPLLANVRYRIRGYFPYTANAVTTGLAISWMGPAAPVLTRAHMYADTTAGAQIGVTINGTDTSTPATTAGSPGTTGNFAYVNGIWSNGPNAGTLQMRVKSSTAAGAITILAGSLLEYAIY